MKYRKKPVVIDAEVYKRGMEDGFDKCNPNTTCGEFRNLNWKCETCDRAKPYILTLEGPHYISPGDYIVTGVKGERYPVKPDIFELTYEKVED